MTLHIPFEIYLSIFEYLENKSYDIIFFSIKNIDHFFIEKETLKVLHHMLKNNMIKDISTIANIMIRTIKDNLFLKFGFHTYGPEFYSKNIVPINCLVYNINFFNAIFDKIIIDINIVEQALIYDVNLGIKCLDIYLSKNIIDKISFKNLFFAYYNDKLIEYAKTSQHNILYKYIFDENGIYCNVSYNLDLTLLNAKYYEPNKSLFLNEITLIDLEYIIVNHVNNIFVMVFKHLMNKINIDVLGLAHIAFYSDNSFALQYLLHQCHSINPQLYDAIRFVYPNVLKGIIKDNNLSHYIMTYPSYGNNDIYKKYDKIIYPLTSLKMGLIHNETPDVINMILKNLLKNNNVELSSEYFKPLMPIIKRCIIGTNKESAGIRLGIEYLVYDNNIDELNEILYIAGYWGNIDVIETILEYYMDSIDKQYILISAIDGNQTDVIEYLTLWNIYPNINALEHCFNSNSNMFTFAAVVTYSENIILDNFESILNLCCNTSSELQFNKYIYIVKLFANNNISVPFKLANKLYLSNRGNEKLAILKYLKYNISEYHKFSINATDYDNICANIENGINTLHYCNDELKYFKNGLLKNNKYLNPEFKRYCHNNQNNQNYSYMDNEYPITYTE